MVPEVAPGLPALFLVVGAEVLAPVAAAACLAAPPVERRSLAVPPVLALPLAERPPPPVAVLVRGELLLRGAAGRGVLRVPPPVFPVFAALLLPALLLPAAALRVLPAARLERVPAAVAEARLEALVAVARPEVALAAARGVDEARRPSADAASVAVRREGLGPLLGGLPELDAVMTSVAGSRSRCRGLGRWTTS